MNIAVCIKQVPTLSRIDFDHKNKTMIREGVPLEINSFDLVALGSAIDLRDEVGGEVTVLTMGPRQARDALAHCLAAGADRAVLITDRCMAGSDTLATARTLAMTLKTLGFDMILCGRNSIDSETGQVGPEIAELLDIPHVSRARKIELVDNSKCLRIERVTDDGYEVLECSLPALVTAAEGLSKERWPRRREIEEAAERPIQEVKAIDLSEDLSPFGFEGSPTFVEEIRLVKSNRMGKTIENQDPIKAAHEVGLGIQKRSCKEVQTERRKWSRFPGASDKSIWVVVDKFSSNIRRSTFEILGKARELAEDLKSEVVAVFTTSVTDYDANMLASYGADRVLALNGPKHSHITGPLMTASLSEFIQERNPFAVLFSSSADGRDIASRIAARLCLGLTGDCIDMELDEQGRLVQLKPALGGNAVASILSKTHPYMVTLRAGVMSSIAPEMGVVVPVERHDVGLGSADGVTVLEVHQENDAKGAELDHAEVVIGVGMGVGGKENLSTIFGMAERLGATVAATRSVADSGWMPKQVQIGITGRTISPKLYIAVGVRGSFNHMVGLQNSGTIVAINNNPRHPIFQASDFTISGDWKVYLPALVDVLWDVLDRS